MKTVEEFIQVDDEARIDIVPITEQKKVRKKTNVFRISFLCQISLSQKVRMMKYTTLSAHRVFNAKTANLCAHTLGQCLSSD